MPIQTELTIDHSETQVDALRRMVGKGSELDAALKFKDFVKMITSGIRPAKLALKVNAVKAIGTITLSGHVATNTVTIAGVQLVADTDYTVGGDDTATAANLAQAINDDATLSTLVSATSAAGVVTITALVPGLIGHAVTLAISANGSVSGARLASGSNGQTSTHYFGSQAES